MALFDTELRLLPALAGRLPLPVPVPELVGVPARRLPVALLGRPAAARVEVCDAGLAGRGPGPARRGPRRASSRALHDPRLSPPSSARGLPGDPMRRAHPVGPRPDRPRLAGPAGRPRPLGPRVGAGPRRRRRCSRAAPTRWRPPPDGEPVLVHGDLHLRHVLVGADGGAAGVIDWGDAAWPTPRSTCRSATPPSPARPGRRFFAAYGARSGPGARAAGPGARAALCAVLADYADVEGRSRRCSPSRWPGRRAVRSPDGPRSGDLDRGVLAALLGGELRPVQLGVEPARGAAARRAGPRSTIRPSSTTRIWSASRTVDSRCAITSEVRPSSAIFSARCTATSDSESRCAVASSSTTTSGALSSSRAMASRCFSPPESR